MKHEVYIKGKNKHRDHCNTKSLLDLLEVKKNNN